MRNINKKISNILLKGILISSLFIVIGILIALFKNNEYDINAVYSFNFSIFSNFDFSNYEFFLMLGIFILILTPIIRVIGMGIEYYLEKNYKYAKISFVIIIILIISFILGLLKK